MTPQKTLVGICLTLPMWYCAAVRMGALGATLHPESWFVVDSILLPVSGALALLSLGLLAYAAAKGECVGLSWGLASWLMAGLGPWGMLLLFEALWKHSRG